jgi:hypothetical protein
MRNKIQETISQWLVAGVYAAPVFAIVFLLFQRIPQGYAKAWDIKWGYYAVLALFAWFCIALILNAKEIFQRTKNHLPSIKAGLGLAALLILFAVFASTQISLQHRVLSDETSWESMALEMRFNQSGGVCNQGVWINNALECKDVVNNFKGKAFGFVQSLVFLFAEPGRDTALKINLPLAMASVALLFFAMFRFTRDEWLALTAAIFLASQPIFLMQSRSASTEVLYIFLFAALFAFYSIISPKEVNYKHFALIVPLLGFFAQTRQETLFCFIPFVLFYHSYFLAKPHRLAIFTALVILASWPAINTMIAYRGYDFQGGEYAAHSFANFTFNLKSNIEVMWNAGLEQNGLLKNPFYTSYTLLLFASFAWLLFRVFFQKKYRWAASLFALFCLQIAVILFNVSGTFTIDINQRYVLVALPLFAIVMAAGLCDASMGRSKIVCAAAAIFACYLSWHHIDSFNKNILYSKNKLLAEENFLNDNLRTLPKNSIFIYARPWQMLASGFNGFSEQKFLNWSPSELQEWRNFSGDNIYIVRGQDGYGNVDRNSRVVGFKTTSTIDGILGEYKTERIFSQTRPFGYPLEAYKIGEKGEVDVYVFARPEGSYLLQDIKLSSWKQDWGEPGIGKSVDGNAIKIDRKIFEFGIGAHANSKLVWALNGLYKKFHSHIGLDDESACGNGAVWVVKGDGKLLYSSRVLNSHEIDFLSIDIEGVDILELETLDSGDKDCDHTDWAGAWLE